MLSLNKVERSIQFKLVIENTTLCGQRKFFFLLRLDTLSLSLSFFRYNLQQ